MFNIFNLFKPKKSKNKKGSLYICGQCNATEVIPCEILEKFDIINPEQLLYGPHTFRCEKCNTGVMQPQHYEAIVKGAGLYEGLDYTIKTTTPHRKSKKKRKKHR